MNQESQHRFILDMDSNFLISCGKQLLGQRRGQEYFASTQEKKVYTAAQ